MNRIQSPLIAGFIFYKQLSINNLNMIKVTFEFREYKDTLYKNLIKEGKSVGNTTRQVNQAIEDLFEGFTLNVKDHCDNGENKEANYELVNNILFRLLTEHKMSNKNISVNYKSKYPTIELV